MLFAAKNIHGYVAYANVSERLRYCDSLSDDILVKQHWEFWRLVKPCCSECIICGGDPHDSDHALILIEVKH